MFKHTKTPFKKVSFFIYRNNSTQNKLLTISTKMVKINARINRNSAFVLCVMNDAMMIIIMSKNMMIK